MLPLLVMGLNIFTGVLFALVAIPAFIVGFSTPVFAWWSTSNSYFGLPTTRRLAEWMLIAGMISTLPAIAINSFLSPVLLNGVGLETTDVSNLGFGLILMLSAPIGEELCKAAAVLALSRFIDGPRRGFQVGFTVGLGFALLENSMYILGAFMSGEETAITFALTSVLRAISSIPGHGVWTGISGFAIGSYLHQKKARLVVPGYQQTQPERIQSNENWVLIDSAGHVMKHSNQEQNQPLLPPSWLSAPPEKAIPLSKKPLQALGFAMILHSFWNGSLWALSLLLADAHVLLGLLVSTVWMSMLILALWQFTRRIFPTVLS
jgi:RsiW-degrading membrane proteinase PrsW (M82 family)